MSSQTMNLKREGHTPSDEADQSLSWPSEKKKKRRSRWANDEADKTFIPGMPTTLPADATDEQKEQYLLQLQIEESSRRLRSGDLGISANPEERSPSPEPIYNNEGKRMNTREYRTRKALEEDRHEKIQKLLALNANYKPPTDYKPPIVRVNDKVFIPQDDHPEINFVGLLIGPRGNTLKTLEKETGAKIIIRGKGSVKEGKIGRKDGQPLPGEDEPLHAYITANDPEFVKKAVAKIHEIIKEGIEIPEEKNDLRKQQLRELALLNGTLRDNDGLQKLRQIAEAETIITNQIICSKCGAAGHIARDCVQKTPAELAQSQMVATKGMGDLPTNTIVGRQDRAKMDSEYMSLMAELGQVAPETVKAELASKMPQQTMNQTVPAANGNDYTKGSADVHVAASNTPTLSADYGYGGRRSRFDEFNTRNFSNERFGGPQSFNNMRPGGPPRFDQSLRPGHLPRFDQGPQPRFGQSRPPFAYNQGPHPHFDQSTPFDQRPPGTRFDRGPPEQQGLQGWEAPPQPPGSGNMMNSNRWGSPAGVAPPPPPMLSPPAPPPPMSTSFGPPPPPPSSWSRPQMDNASWHQSAAPTPPWQSHSSYGSNPAAPPPPPPSSESYGNFSNYVSNQLPPPPPPQ